MGRIETRLPITETVKVAVLLDPAMKDLLDMPADEKIDLLEEKAERCVATCSEAGDVEAVTVSASPVPEDADLQQEPASKKLKLLERFRASVMPNSSTQASNLRSEVSRYIASTPALAKEDHSDPLKLWAENENQFPRLAKVARQYHCIMPSSVAVESMFSTTGLILNSKRSCMAPCRLNYTSFIHDNYKLF